MKTMTAAAFKSHFFEALNAVRNGETILVSYGLNRRLVAAMVPYAQLKAQQRRPLGLLKSKVQVSFVRTFALTDKEFLKS